MIRSRFMPPRRIVVRSRQVALGSCHIDVDKVFCRFWFVALLLSFFAFVSCCSCCFVHVHGSRIISFRLHPDGGRRTSYSLRQASSVCANTLVSKGFIFRFLLFLHCMHVSAALHCAHVLCMCVCALATQTRNPCCARRDGATTAMRISCAFPSASYHVCVALSFAVVPRSRLKDLLHVCISQCAWVDGRSASPSARKNGRCVCACVSHA